MNEYYAKGGKGNLKTPIHEENTNSQSIEEHQKKFTSMKFIKTFGKDFPAKINFDFETVQKYYSQEEYVRVEGIHMAVDICKQNMRGMDPFIPIYMVLAIFQVMVPWLISKMMGADFFQSWNHMMAFYIQMMVLFFFFFLNCVLVNALREFMTMKVKFKKTILSQLDPYIRETFEEECNADVPNIHINVKNLMSSFQMVGILQNIHSANIQRGQGFTQAIISVMSLQFAYICIQIILM